MSLKIIILSLPFLPPTTPFTLPFPFVKPTYHHHTHLHSSPSPLPPPSNTTRRLIIGLNKYTHDTTLCAADASTGHILYNLELERLTRRKHDAGSTSLLLENCLDYLDLDETSIDLVVVNNHHHRVLPLEEDVRRVEWYEGLDLNGCDASPENLLPGCETMELSHHLAHAYSVASQAPFGEGVVVVMDGMGETYRTMRKGLDDDRYFSDLEFDGKFESVPRDIDRRVNESVWDWREGESVYKFRKNEEEGLVVEPLFKRWIEERTPPTLFNHGFENMMSVGAVYSRISSHIFGDWNVCGKVMGLAPWKDHVWDDLPEENRHRLKRSIMEGSLYDESNPLVVHWENIAGAPLASQRIYDPATGAPLKKYDFDDTNPPMEVALDAISYAHSVQTDLETVVLDFISEMKNRTNAVNLCLAGGVALNSVLNGRIVRELGFEEVFIPPYPGDEGVAMGCCAYGLFNARKQRQQQTPSPPVWTTPHSPHLGPLHPSSSIQNLLETYAPWIDIVDTFPNPTQKHSYLANELASGTVVAYYQSRSESGPRALGHRSILADPRKKKAISFINELKKREGFRPFAPSVLAEHASEWFELDNANKSPYMSLTTGVTAEKRHLIPAVVHVDGSSRLQTVTAASHPDYHGLIAAFFKLTGVPMVLNTSFNTIPGEPIVESPWDALKSFMSTMNGIEILVLDDVIIKRRQADIGKLLGSKKISKGGLITPPSPPSMAGSLQFRSECTITSTDDTIREVTMSVRMPDRILHDDETNGGWFELLDEFEGEILGMCDGTRGVEDMVREWHPEEEIQKGKFDQTLFENMIRRLVRLFEFTFISW